MATIILRGTKGSPLTNNEVDANFNNINVEVLSIINTMLPLKAPLASPALTGIPTAPTAPLNTNTTQLATTAFVLRQAGTASPLRVGVGAVGTSTKFAREDHSHPINATSTNTASTIVARDASGNFSAGTITAAINGNASTVTKLATARTISLTGDVTGSTSFDGSGNASIAAVVVDDSHNHIISNVDGLQTALNGKQAALGFTPVQQGGGTGQGTNKVYIGWATNASGLMAQVDKTNFGISWPINITKNAATATKLATARTISLTGDVTGSASFDGSANASITATVVDDSHNHIISNVDGLQAALNGKDASSHTHTAAQLPTASTSAAGVVQLSTSTSSTSTTLAATASAVKAAYDLAASKVSKDHGHNVVGSLCFAYVSGATVSVNAGATLAGSALVPAGVSKDPYQGTNTVCLTSSTISLSGTWRCLGYALYSNWSPILRSATLWQRIS